MKLEYKVDHVDGSVIERLCKVTNILLRLKVITWNIYADYSEIEAIEQCRHMHNESKKKETTAYTPPPYEYYGITRPLFIVTNLLFDLEVINSNTYLRQSPVAAFNKHYRDISNTLKAGAV